VSAVGRALSISVLTATFAACGGSPPPPPAPATPPKPAATPAPSRPVGAVQPAPGAAKSGQPAAGSQQAADALRAAQDVSTPPKPRYEIRGRRDPFENLEIALKEREVGGGFSVASTKLTGIVQGRTTPLALVETAEGHGYILKPGDTLGDGRVLEIGRDSVVFAVQPKPGSPTNRVVLKLTTD
jgi:hypothetical protein